MNTAFLLTGGNMGNRAANLEKEREIISAECGSIISASSLYETAAWGKTEQPSFLNQALKISTSLTALQLIRRVLKAEKKIGRIRKEKFGPRIIDIDILLFNDEVHNFSLLKVPHPELQNRRFALLPLAEIAPGAIHPLLKKNIEELLNECPDTLPAKKYS
ncbi:MAG: 2-amino-4-hydroxy-6-hydroxymethyldihydropteridine diphosphokinase [Chitinophagaceae bacterium]|nr:2-amino-4-hydroxy-6-hydroxymethyldihydropteridine diphosphokinase [Chitinophagaceae bacterium]